LDQEAVTATRTGSTKEIEQGGDFTTTAARQQHAATVRVGSADTQVKDKTTVREDTQEVLREAVPKQKVEDDKRKQHEEDAKRRQHDADEKRRQLILQLTSRRPDESGKTMPAEDTPTTTTTTGNAPNLEDVKLLPSRETTSWRPKVHLPWDETTLMPPPYFVALAESLGFPKVARRQQYAADDYSSQQWHHQQFPSHLRASGYASSGGAGMGRGRDNGNNPAW
jgi:hypothetical protein